jgi:hypothetical protein
MKSSISISVVAIALVTTIMGTSAAMALEAYKTKIDQVVVTGLKAKKKYDVQYKSATGKDGKRKVDTNACGEALISKMGKFQSVMIDGQNIDPKTLTVKEHRRCSARKNSTSTRRTPTKNIAKPITVPITTPSPMMSPGSTK